MSENVRVRDRLYTADTCSSEKESRSAWLRCMRESEGERERERDTDPVIRDPLTDLD